jgi:hypothetical protein
MKTLLTKKSISITELRQPAKVLKCTGTTPVAILNRNTVVAYLVPADAVNLNPSTKATDVDVKATLARRRKTIAPVLKYLADK